MKRIVFVALIPCAILFISGELLSFPTPAYATSCGFGSDIGGGQCGGFLTSPTGSNQTFTSPKDWNNKNNTIEVVGAGGSGGMARGSNARLGAGGGGGEYGKTTNFTFAVPGTTQATYQIGTGGTAITLSSNGVTSGNNGGDTWWNGATQAGATLGAIGGSGGVSDGGSGTRNSSGGIGGTAGVGTTHNAGGRGGNITNGTVANVGAGGGGAGGPNGVGGNGGDLDAPSAGTATDGGQGDATSGGAGGIHINGGITRRGLPIRQPRLMQLLPVSSTP